MHGVAFESKKISRVDHNATLKDYKGHLYLLLEVLEDYKRHPYLLLDKESLSDLKNKIEEMLREVE